MTRRIRRTLATAAAISIPVVAELLCTASAGGAVSLASLGGATVQTLIDLGGDGVTAGGERYYDFSYAASAGAPAASAVRVQGVSTATDGDGVRFVAAWVAAGGQVVSSTVSFAVAPVDPTMAFDQISLLANGSAPVPAAGTFVTATTAAATPSGALAVPILTTFDDGRTAPVDTTRPDTDVVSEQLVVPQSDLTLTDTVTAIAGPTGGVATASTVQTLFALVPAQTVPEPTMASLLALATAGAWARRRRPFASK